MSDKFKSAVEAIARYRKSLMNGMPLAPMTMTARRRAYFDMGYEQGKVDGLAIALEILEELEKR